MEKSEERFDERRRKSGIAPCDLRPFPEGLDASRVISVQFLEGEAG
jgi:hypothetical protein